MTLSKSGRFRAEASFQQSPPSSISSINLSYCSLSVASFIAAKHIALARAHHPRQPNPHSVCGSSLAQSTRGFVLWRLPDAGPGARRSISHGRHPKPLYERALVKTFLHGAYQFSNAKGMRRPLDEHPVSAGASTLSAGATASRP